MDGRIFSTHRKAGTTAIPIAGGLVVEAVRKQIAHRCVFQASSTQLLLWGACTPQEMKELAERFHLVVDVMLQRVKSDFAADLLRTAFQAFDLSVVRQVWDGQGDEAAHRKKACLRGVRILLDTLGLDVVRDILDCRDVVPAFVVEYTKQEDAGATANMRPDNREIWALVRDADFVRRVPGRFAPIHVLPQLINVHLSVQDGECEVERYLGKVTAVLANHANISTSSLCDIVVLSSGGPASADELKGSGRELSVFLRECASLWIQWHKTPGRSEKRSKGDKEHGRRLSEAREWWRRSGPS